MNDTPNDGSHYQNNPLQGVSLKTLLTELVEHYGFEILFAYLGIHCFQVNPSIDSSVKFLKKTDWAREKVESFYLYEFKNLPHASPEQFALPPRERVIPEGVVPGEPAVLSLEDAERLREKRAKKSAARRAGKDFGAPRGGRPSSGERVSAPRREREPAEVRSPVKSTVDPWAKWRKNVE